MTCTLRPVVGYTPILSDEAAAEREAIKAKQKCCQEEFLKHYGPRLNALFELSDASKASIHAEKPLGKILTRWKVYPEKTFEEVSSIKESINKNELSMELSDLRKLESRVHTLYDIAYLYVLACNRYENLCNFLIFARVCCPINIAVYQEMDRISVEDLSLLWLGIEPVRKDYDLCFSIDEEDKVRIVPKKLEPVKLAQKIIISAVDSGRIQRFDISPKEEEIKEGIIVKGATTETNVSLSDFIRWWIENKRPFAIFNDELVEHHKKLLFESSAGKSEAEKLKEELENMKEELSKERALRLEAEQSLNETKEEISGINKRSWALFLAATLNELGFRKENFLCQPAAWAKIKIQEKSPVSWALDIYEKAHGKKPDNEMIQNIFECVKVYIRKKHNASFNK